MAHLDCRRRGDRMSVSTENDQATITDDGLFGRLVLSLGISLRFLLTKDSFTNSRERRAFSRCAA